jgi:outer membrane protein OmpA-like peptidoglycan-associated protein
VYGTGAGAAAGAAVGAILGGGEGAWKGAAVGAAIGGLSGTAVGYYLDKQKKEMEEVLERQDRVERDGEVLRVALSSDVLFDSGSATLQPGAQTSCARWRASSCAIRARASRSSATRTTAVRETSNQTLSDRRAAAVRTALVTEGVDPGRISVRGEGELRPVATNDTAEGRAQNSPRRDPVTSGRGPGRRGSRGVARRTVSPPRAKSRAEPRAARSSVARSAAATLADR